jgi:hypothetical protein
MTMYLFFKSKCIVEEKRLEEISVRNSEYRKVTGARILKIVCDAERRNTFTKQLPAAWIYARTVPHDKKCSLDN